MLRRGELVAVALVFLLTLPAVTSRFYASDEIQFFAWLHSWTFDRDADFDNEYRHFYDNGTVHHDGFRQTFLEDVNEAGRRFNFAPIGSALLWLPFYGAGHVAAGLAGAPQDGYSRPYVASVAIGSAVLRRAARCCSPWPSPGGSPARGRPRPCGSWPGRRSRSTCTSRRVSRTPARPSPWRCSSGPGFASVRTWTPARRGLPRRGRRRSWRWCASRTCFFLVGPAIDFSWQAWRAARHADRPRRA